MHLVALDWVIMGVAFAVYLAIGLWVGRDANKDYASYFLSGRSMPWWLLGTSMVATTFATDTPNLVTGIVRQHGVAGNWVWWAFLLTGASTVFFFAKLWRRSDVLTDIEFYELRYSGKPAAFLRGFRAVYLGVFFNLMVMANVTLAAIKIGGVMLGLSPLQTITIAAVVTVAYSSIGGLTGVLVTDLIQFAIAMIGSIWAAHYVVHLPQVGGLASLLSNPAVIAKMNLLPDFQSTPRDVVLGIFVIPLAVQWWSSYYPGAEPGGGGYVVQRILAAKNETHGVVACLFFNLMHYAIRPWPWILVAFASLIVFPTVASLRAKFPNLPDSMIQNDLAYPAMLTFLPPGLLGIVVTSLIAAYMSTMSTQINYGSSILVNDVYRRFLNPKASERKLVIVGQLVTLALMAASCWLALQLQDALSNFEIMLQIGAGTGLLLIVRWFWWRINAIAEITAMFSSFAIAVYFFLATTGIHIGTWHFKPNWPGATLPDWQRLSLGVALTTLSWLFATLVSRPTDPANLREFVRRIRPEGPGWKSFAPAHASSSPSSLPAALACTLGSTIGIWALIFAGGYLLYGKWLWASLALTLAAAAVLLLKKLWPRLSVR